MSSFQLQLEEFAKAAGDRCDLFVRKVAADILTGVVLKSPVDQGTFRANWTVSLGTRSGFASEEVVDKTGSVTIEKGLQVLTGYKTGQSIYVSNGLPYGPKLEFGGYPNPPENPTGKTSGGYSIQAPRGMVRITMLEVQERIAAITAALNRGKQ